MRAVGKPSSITCAGMAGLSRVPQGRQASFGRIWRMTNRLQSAAALAAGAACGVVAELNSGQGIIGQLYATGMVAAARFSNSPYHSTARIRSSQECMNYLHGIPSFYPHPTLFTFTR